MAECLMKMTITCIVLFCALITEAQQINPMTDTLIWSYNQIHNLRNQEAVTSDGQFQVNGRSTINWIQKGGEVVFTFNISGRTGTWMNINEDGSITYTVAYEASKGTIRMSRSESVITIDMDIDNPTRPNTQYKFTITAVQPKSN